MEAKTYRVKSMKEALELIRKELGPNASVLHSRKIGQGMLGWLTGERLEVVASNEAEVPSRFDSLADELEMVEQFLSDSAGFDLQNPNPNPKKTQQPDSPSINLNSTKTSPSEKKQSPISNGARMFTGPFVISDRETHVIAVVGPTGVGKTTTLAKWAADLKLNRKLRVGLITVDTYRVAAIDQLQTYADILEIPLAVVSNSDEMVEAMAAMKSQVDVVLIDTAGQSLRDSQRLHEIHSILRAIKIHETHLVISSTTHSKSLSRICQTFAQYEPKAIVLSKVDEATHLTDFLGELARFQIPLSFITNGQNVPDDIEVADESQLRNLLGSETQYAA